MHPVFSLRAKGLALYGALSRGDAATLENLLSSDFHGSLCEGLPLGLGRDYHGRDAMMQAAWGPIDALFALDVKVDRLFEASAFLIGIGRYEGRARSSGREIRAAFAHFWQFDGDRFVGLRQVTDTALWRDALAP